MNSEYWNSIQGRLNVQNEEKKSGRAMTKGKVEGKWVKEIIEHQTMHEEKKRRWTEIFWYSFAQMEGFLCKCARRIFVNRSRSFLFLTLRRSEGSRSDGRGDLREGSLQMEIWHPPFRRGKRSHIGGHVRKRRQGGEIRRRRETGGIHHKKHSMRKIHGQKWRVEIMEGKGLWRLAHGSSRQNA